MATGCTVSPHMVSIWLIVNYTLGGIKDRYINYEGAGDKFVGRDVSGITISKK